MSEAILVGLFWAALSVDWLTGRIGALQRAPWLVYVFLILMICAVYAVAWAFAQSLGGKVIS